MAEGYANLGRAGTNIPSSGHAPRDELRLFCRAVLDLLSELDGTAPLLSDVLPSFAEHFARGTHRVSLLRSELAVWTDRAERLTRLASRHGGEGSAALVEHLRSARAEGTALVEALESLHVRATGEPTHASEASTAPGSSDAAADLRRFCAAVLALVPGTPGPVLLDEMIPSIGGLFRGCPPETTVALRSELSLYRAETEDLVRLAAVHCPAAAVDLQRRVRRTQSLAAGLLDSLEVLHVAAVRPEPVAAASHGPPLGADGHGASHGHGATNGRSASNGSADAQSVDVEHLFREASTRHQRGRAADSLRLLGEVLRLDPLHRAALVQRGHVLLSAGRIDQAVADLSQAIVLDPDDPGAYRLRGDAAVLAGRFADAIADYDRALERSPLSDVVRYIRAVALRQSGDVQRAWDELEQLLRGGYRTSALHLNRGLILCELGDPEPAVREFRAALALRPDCREARERLEALGVPLEEPMPEPADPPRSTEPAPRTGDEPTATVAARGTPDGLAPQRRPAHGRRANEGATIRRDAGHAAPGMSVPHPTAVPTSNSRSVRPVEPAPPIGTTAARDGAAAIDDDEVVSILVDDDDDAGDSRIGLGTERDTAVDLVDSDTAIDPAGTGAVLAEARAGTIAPRRRVPRTARIPDGPPTASLAESLLSDSQGTSQPASKYRLVVECPSCGEKSAAAYERLQKGRIFRCPACERNFTVEENGQLASVAKGDDGRWMLERLKERKPWSRRTLAVVGSVAAATLVSLIALPFVLPTAAPTPLTFPDELEPRVVAFAEAWLKKDYRVLNELTLASQRAAIFAWHRSHPAPVEAAPSAKIEVHSVTREETVADLKVKFTGLLPPDAETREVALHWKRIDGEWQFAPDPHGAVSTSRFASGPAGGPAAGMPARRPTASGSPKSSGPAPRAGSSHPSASAPASRGAYPAAVSSPSAIGPGPSHRGNPYVPGHRTATQSAPPARDATGRPHVPRGAPAAAAGAAPPSRGNPFVK